MRKSSGRSAKFVVDGLDQRPHVGNGIGGAYPVVHLTSPECDRGYAAVELHFVQRLHHVIHILIAIVDRRLYLRFRHRVGDIAEMDFEELIFGAKVFDRADDADTHHLSLAFQRSAAHTQTDANVGAVGNLYCLLVTGKVANIQRGMLPKS